MSKRKIYVVGGATNYANWINNSELTNDMSKADIVLFTGGCDVDPSFYGKEKNPETYSNIERDINEKKEVEQILKTFLKKC